MLFVRHMAMGSKTIGKCSDFLTHRFWNKGRCLKKPDACRIMTIRSTVKEVKEKEPPRSRRVFSQAVRPLLIVVTRLFFEPAVAKAFLFVDSFWCKNSWELLNYERAYVAGILAVKARPFFGAKTAQGDRPKLERSLTQSLEEPKPKSKAVKMKADPIGRRGEFWGSQMIQN